MNRLPGIDYDCTDSNVDDIDVVYDTIDEMLRHGKKLVQIDDLLGRVDVSKLSIVLMLSYLTITASASSLLPNRRALYERIHVRLTIIDPERVDDLLHGLF
jgi:hypothetical protein